MSGGKAVSLGGMTRFCFAYSVPCIEPLRLQKEHQQVELGVSKQEVNKTVQFKSEANVKYPAARVPVRKDILAEAADWELQFDMTPPWYNQTRARCFPVEILRCVQMV